MYVCMYPTFHEYVFAYSKLPVFVDVGSVRV